MGPFEVSAEQIERLGAAFTQFVNQLLILESADLSMLGHELRVDSQDETGDGGIDAGLTATKGSTWIPIAKSGWQFKRGDNAPAKCKEELEGAKWAHELIGSGASYTLALGRRLGDQKIERRLRALVGKAQELGLLVNNNDDRIRVLDANALARWASEFPSFAISRLLGGPGGGVIDFGTWSRSQRHQGEWVGSDDRDQLISRIRDVLADPAQGEVRIQGESGIGKTRLVMEAMRTQELQPLVAYVPDAGNIAEETLGYVLSTGRTLILVVDECSGRAHEKLAERITLDSTVRLVSIGDDDGYSLRSPVLEVEAMSDDSLDGFLRRNFSPLPAEIRRFVVQQSSGNVRLAALLGGRLLDVGEAQAADLIQKEDLSHILLPEGRTLHLATFLALFTRVGWEREVEHQLESIAEYAATSPADLREVGQELDGRGLLIRQGRYRAVTPHPLAVLLAAERWREQGQSIVDELLPRLDPELQLSLFSRVADLGRYEPARKVLRTLMAETGPFGTLTSIDEHDLGRLLTQLAIVAPEETAHHLARLIDAEPLDQLWSLVQSRRDLVWTLEKLAWHRGTFDLAANALIKLARAENESWANNATGTWTALFGTGLPATAATPDERLRYLRLCAESEIREIRALVAGACSRGLSPHEWVSVSGELQAGAYVEPRGGVKTYQEASHHRASLVEILAELSDDDDAGVSRAAEDALISALFPFIGDSLMRPALIPALVNLRGDAAHRLRREIQRERILLKQIDRPQTITGLEELERALPRPAAVEELMTLLELGPWELEHGELRGRVERLTEELVHADAVDEILSWLSERPLPGGWFLGHTLAAHVETLPWLGDRLLNFLEFNLSVLAGYLTGLVDSGMVGASDEFLDQERSVVLSPSHVLELTTRGPETHRAKERLIEIIPQLSVEEGTYGTIRWQPALADEEVVLLLADWSSRMLSQSGYNALIDWLSLWYHRDRDLPAQARVEVLGLLKRRLEFPDLGNERWDWAQIAKRFVPTHSSEVARVLLDLVSEKDLIFLDSDEEAEILRSAAQVSPLELWTEVAQRLEREDWRIAMDLRSWFTEAIPVDVLADWVQDSVRRARLLAGIAHAGAGVPSDAARFLLVRFGHDDEVRSLLVGDYLSGSWMGPESSRIENLIHQLGEWLAPEEPPAVRDWATELIGQLEERKAAVVEREAEGRF
jgi:hypothetical protein